MQTLRFCACSILLFLCAPTFAQYQQKIDSLRERLPEVVSDTLLSERYAYMAKFFVLQGVHFDSARYYAEQAISVGDQVGYLDGMEKGYFALAYVYSFQGRHAESIRYYLKAKEILELGGDEKAVGTVLNNIGKIYFDLNELEKAQDFFQRSLLKAEHNQDTSQMLVSYGNIGIILSTRDQHHEALNYYRKALSLALKINSPQDQLAIYQNIGGIYFQLGKVDSALYAGERTLALASQLNMTTHKIRGLCFMGEIHLATDQPVQALTFIQEGIALADTVHHLMELAALYHYLIDGYTATQQIEQGRLATPKALQICYRSGRLGSIASIHKSISELEALGGDYAEALYQQGQYHQWKDSLLTLEKEEKLAEMQTRFDTERKDQEIASLGQQGQIQKLEIKQKNILLLVLLLGGLLIASAIYFYFRQRTIREKQARMEAQQRLLQTQMNPHFLFNALSSIQSLIYEQEDPETATFYLARFAKLMRLILENSRSPFISLEQEITTLRFYLDLQKLRFENNFAYEIEVDAALEPDSLQIPPMFAQPFLENTLEHGFRSLDKTGQIRIQFRKRDQMMELIVEDNGIGREEAARLGPGKEHRSLALEIMRDRLQLLSDKVKQQVDLTIEDLQEQTGTRVTLSLPLLYQY